MCAVYDDYVDDHFEHDSSTIFDDGGKMCNYMSNMAIIELVASLVEERVQQIIQTIFSTRLFEVDGRDLQWHHKDLVVSLRTLQDAQKVGRGQTKPLIWY
jgi:predicted nucleic-acid-binding protein